MPAKCPGNDGDFVFRSTHMYTIKQTHIHTDRQTAETSRQTIHEATTMAEQQSVESRKNSRKSRPEGHAFAAAAVGQEGNRNDEGRGARGEGVVAEMTTRMNLAAQIKIISSCL